MIPYVAQLPQRPRRNRRSPAMRDLMRENSVQPQDMVLPVFVCEGEDQVQPIASMPGVARYGLVLSSIRCSGGRSTWYSWFGLIPRHW